MFVADSFDKKTGGIAAKNRIPPVSLATISYFNYGDFLWLALRAYHMSVSSCLEYLPITVTVSLIVAVSEAKFELSRGGA